MLNLHINGTNIDNQLKKFWELEEIPYVKNKILTSEEQFVETHFQNTYVCYSDGCFVVKLPFYKSNSELGDAKPVAISRLLPMERKFKNNPDFEKQYKEFMNEYKSLGHMSLVNSNFHTSNKDLNILPHHAVIKPSSTTTKLRVVFDASLLQNYKGYVIKFSARKDWLKFQKAFNAINYLTVPRWVILTADNTMELHGFADASSLAYAAAIYCRQKHNGKIKVQLLVSKTKVVPVKQVSIPRLEFHPRKWKTFVANKTSEIMEVLPTKPWRHVPSKENPADIATRGIDPKCLPDCMLWWHEPPWLRLETSSWLKAESSCDEASNEEEIQSIKKQISLPPKSPLRSLHPFIDEHGLVRVGGRLQNSQLRFNSKHPIILPSQQTISELLNKEQHIAHLHVGRLC
ncbi:integrase catalytic domain-containing protein [Trichonephila clavipes]|nr:integrase catalytic domain-containing protein [Trichonephila clavipes]